MKNSYALLTAVLLALTGGSVAAQESLLPSTGGMGDLPPGVGLGQDESLVVPSGETPLLDDAGELIRSPAPGEHSDEFLPGSILGEPMQLLGACPADFESSGTWLKRGFWYTEIDYVFLNRGWDRHGEILAHEERLENVNPSNPVRPPYLVANSLSIGGHKPGAEGVARVKLGRFLFRDGENRDHVTEVGWYGGGRWTQQLGLEASTPAGLQVLNPIDAVNISFDDAQSMEYRYDSEMNSAEWNYLVKQRMHRDQMVLRPSGEWVRSATPSRTYSFLAGLRYVNVREELDWTASEIPVSAVLEEGGFYRVDTENNMIGTQLGASLGRETARWSLTGSAKVGTFWNRVDLNAAFQVGETTILNSGVTNTEEDELSFVGEFQLLGKWHLRPNVSIRAGFELLWMESLALAPHQLNFIPGGYSAIATGGENVFLGTSLGVESYW